MTGSAGSGPFQFAPGTSRQLDVEILLALAPAIFLHAWVVGPYPLAIGVACYAISLLLPAMGKPGFTESFHHTRRDASLPAFLLITLLLLPPDATGWAAVSAILFTTIVIRTGFGQGSYPFNPAASALLIYLVLTGADSLPAAADYANIPIQMLSGQFLPSLVDRDSMAVLELRNLLLTAAALVLVARNTMSWHMPVLIVLALGASVTALNEPLDALLSQWLHSALPVFLLYVATDTRSSPAGSRARLLFSILLFASFYVLGKFYAPLVAMVTATIFANLCAPLLEQICATTERTAGEYESGEGL